MLYMDMVDITIICVGKNKEKYYQEAASEYIKRLSSACRLNVLELPEAKIAADPSAKEIAAALADEAGRILKNIKKEHYVISLCVEGRKLTSAAFADELSRVFVSGRSRLVFIIGGSFGLDDSVKKASDLRLSISDMTFPHHLARVILLEQIYRAFTIMDGSKYNK